MADQNPTGDSRLVSVDLPDELAGILRRDLADWIADLRGDLQTPERLEDPDRTLVEVAAYERLLEGLDKGEISVPDEYAHRLLRKAAEAHDTDNGYAEVVATHDAMHGLLAVLEEERR